ncbi:hypothetical protein VARIO8X_60315 [Burkholderiales bacterium 8X]|nr:hypothetical protein VARIO8X_60315 [Burkholderiales bacterium 8X]
MTGFFVCPHRARLFRLASAGVPQMVESGQSRQSEAGHS